MSRPLSSGDVFKTHRENLELEWVAGKSGADKHIESESATEQPLVGYFNPIRPNRIQILGNEELSYLQAENNSARQDALHSMFSAGPAMVILVDDVSSPQDLSTMADEHQTPLFRSPQSGTRVIDYLRYHTAELLSEKIVLHGVFLEVMGIGVLLTGPSGVGKSELALELLSRGHHLIADDAPEFVCSAPNIITGTCPPLLHDFLEVRGLGIINIRAMYGDNAIIRAKRLRLIVTLGTREIAGDDAMMRLDGSRRKRHILGVDVPEVLIPVAPGRNLAVILEAAVRNHLLRLNGYDAAADLIGRQQAFMEKNAQ